MRLLLLLLGLAGASVPASADQSVSQGEYRVHYAAINSQALTPEIAARYGVTRRANQALLVLNAQRRAGDGPAQPVAATASGIARDLIGDTQTLQFRSVREDGIDTLVAPFRFDDQQVLNFEIRILPAGAAAPLALRFGQQFFKE
jgi:hypothetical protein